MRSYLVKTGAAARPWYVRKKGRGGDGAAGRALVGVMRRLGLALYNVGARGEAVDPKRLFPGPARRATATAKAKKAEAKDAEAKDAEAKDAGAKDAGAKKTEGTT